MKTRGEKAVREVPAARSQAPAAPVAPAAEAAPVAVSPDAERHRSEVKVDEVLGAALKKAGHGPYELVPGRYPGAVALPDVLAKLGTSPEGQAAVHHLLDEVKTRTGIDVSPEERAALLSNPSGATRALEVTPRQMSLGVLGINAAYEEGKLKPKAAPVLHLPQHGFDLAGIAALDLPRSAPQPKQVAPGLFYGSLPGTLPEAQVKQNQVLAETFDRLSRNASAADGEKFSVTYRGHAYTRLDGLLAALKADGHQVKVTFEQRAANFANLKTQVPGASPVQWLDVPAPLMLRTGVRDGLGHEAVVPAAHSEMIVTLTSGPQTQGPRLDAELRYFQGTDGTGFFAKGGSAEPKWLGRITHAELDGDDALKAVRLAGTLSDVINTSARALGLYADGYGVTGVCNDSVAVVEQALLGRADQYPLLMRDATLLGELKQRLDTPGRDHADYATLRKAIEALPNDSQNNPTRRERALKSIPWADGEEPFTSTVDAKKILAGG